MPNVARMGDTMIFTPLAIPGAYVVELQKHQDDRGFFARGWCQAEFEAQGLPGHIAQINISYNRHQHTLRGFHYQVAPHEEDKLLRCTHGAVHEVLVDLRPSSPAYLHNLAVRLDATNRRMLVVPKGCAHAFLTLEDETELTYLASAPYHGAAERGVRWNDRVLGIRWPVAEPAVISDKDRNWPDYRRPTADALPKPV